MFDDQSQSGQGAPPPNLPIGEPEDIFSGTDAVPESAPPAAPEIVTTPEPASPSPAAAPSQPPAESAAPSALSAGILQPKESVQPEAPDASPVPEAKPQITTPPVDLGYGDMPQTAAGGATYKVQGPSFLRTALLFVVAIVLIAGVIGGLYWVYSSFIKGRTSSTPSEPQAPTTVVDTPVPDTSTETETQPDITQDDQILFGEVLDTDGDGLSDEQERSMGTDPNNWDSDSDELSDYNEVEVWKTNPLLADTDGDGYLDGSEVNNGYSPTGPGRIFQPPTDGAPAVGETTSPGSETGTSQVRPEISEPTPTKPITVIGGEGEQCGKDSACFIAAARACKKAVHTRDTAVDLWDVLGIRQNVSHFAQILGPADGGLCQWYIRLDDIEINFKDDVPQEIQAENRSILEGSIGRDGTCTMAPNEIGDFFARWGEGAFQPDEFSDKQCSGAFFAATS